MLQSAFRPLRAVLLTAVIALMVGLLGPVSPASAAGPITGLNPVITGPPVVGETLTAAQVGPTSPSNNVTFTWQWQTTGTPAVNIVGATNPTLLLTESLVGQQVQVVMTAHANGKDDSPATSTATAVIKNAFTAAPVVGLDDTTPVVDAPITASVTTDSTPAADSYAYQWYADDNLIPGATSATYTPTASDVTKALVAKVTAVKVDYADTVGSSAATDAVVKADFTSQPSVTISGTAVVGATLTANATGEAPAGDSYAYVWKAAGTPIVGATSSTYTVAPADAGKAITVEATAVKAGYNDSTTAVSLPTAAVGLGTFTTAATANLSTTAPKVGSVISVTPSGEVPDTSTFTYQWYRISALGVKSMLVGAVGSDYTPTPGNLNYKLQVKVTATKDGYNNRSSSSVQTARVNQITLSKSTVARGSTLTVTAAHLRSGQVYRIFIDGLTVYKGTVPSTGTVTRTVTVPGSIGTGSTPVRVSGYTKAGARDFTVVTNVPVT